MRNREARCRCAEPAGIDLRWDGGYIVAPPSMHVSGNRYEWLELGDCAHGVEDQLKGIGHDYINPMRPRLNGKIERSHRIDAEEFYRLLKEVVIDDASRFNEKLLEWERF